ncbi:precorrin-8X methylmutase [Fretibacterium sp. OH1220_COT-178]|uniref:precorrin-8X methylmutase n=1 Tax=Fretibacterium sp. OH1220_COT-178 TaxID=2491047 RepID=UPI000F5D730E|nr:precorrin-8X methylmutase [Fretibacterium sp. OH1220_COT-178]RRD65000.1 precorrin-8X methylmutase [Fretibacterium sp. OH1220_COT-178]
MRPEEIERASMAVIEREMGDWTGPEENLPVLKRVIHTTADFDFVRNLVFSPDAVRLGREALRRGVTVVTDTAMAASGISKPSAARWNVPVVCRMADPDVRDEALRRGVTRAVVSMERAVEETPDAIFAIGNAPTALIRLCELVREGAARPSLVIGVPVGFVNVVESKEILVGTDVPHIAAMGRKGGSPVASTIVNALLYGMEP